MNFFTSKNQAGLTSENIGVKMGYFFDDADARDQREQRDSKRVDDLKNLKTEKALVEMTILFDETDSYEVCTKILKFLVTEKRADLIKTLYDTDLPSSLGFAILKGLRACGSNEHVLDGIKSIAAWSRSETLKKQARDLIREITGDKLV